MMKGTIRNLTIAAILLPISGLIYWSFTPRLPWPKLIGGGVDLSTWLALLDQPSLWRSAFFSLALSVLTVLTVQLLILPVCTALLLYKIHIPQGLWLVILLPILMPSISLSIGLHQFFIQLGWRGGFAAVLLAHTIIALPYAFRILYNACTLLGPELGEQATVLGVSLYKTMYFIYLPNLKLPILFSSLLVFIVSFSQYLPTFLLGGGLINTLPIALFPVIQSGSRSEASAYSLFFVILAAGLMGLMEVAIRKHYKGGIDLWHL